MCSKTSSERAPDHAPPKGFLRARACWPFFGARLSGGRGRVVANRRAGRKAANLTGGYGPPGVTTLFVPNGKQREAGGRGRLGLSSPGVGERGGGWGGRGLSARGGGVAAELTI